MNLGDEGLEAGDFIDDYLVENWKSGAEIVIPAGTYRWNGTGLSIEGGDALLRGEGEVVLERTSDVIDEDIYATFGTVEVRNLGIRGYAGDDGRLRCEADAGARTRIVNVWQPDGTNGDSEASGFYTPRRHSGVVEYINCSAQNFGNCGIYASSAGKREGGQGEVHVIGGYFRNNNIASVRLGSPNSSARDCVIVNDGRADARIESGRRQRGVWIKDRGDNILLENLHISHTYTGSGDGEPVAVDDAARGGSCYIDGIYIRNETENYAIAVGSARYDMAGTDINVVGSGNTRIEGSFDDVCIGSGCPVPALTYTA